MRLSGGERTKNGTLYGSVWLQVNLMGWRFRIAGKLWIFECYCCHRSDERRISRLLCSVIIVGIHSRNYSACRWSVIFSSESCSVTRLNRRVYFQFDSGTWSATVSRIILNKTSEMTLMMPKYDVIILLYIILFLLSIENDKNSEFQKTRPIKQILW